jgi:hypothetical protein
VETWSPSFWLNSTHFVPSNSEPHSGCTGEPLPEPPAGTAAGSERLVSRFHVPVLSPAHTVRPYSKRRRTKCVEAPDVVVRGPVKIARARLAVRVAGDRTARKRVWARSGSSMRPDFSGEDRVSISFAQFAAGIAASKTVNKISPLLGHAPSKFFGVISRFLGYALLGSR